MQGKILLPHSNFTAKNATQIRGSFWGSSPDPAGGAYSAPPDPLAAISFGPVTSLTTFLMLPTGLLLMPVGFLPPNYSLRNGYSQFPRKAHVYIADRS